jgi:hypothetical protein
VLLPLADGVLALPDVLPEALPDVLASELGFCSWLVEGVEGAELVEGDCACDSSFFSCATAPNDSNAAATATAMGLNFIENLLSLGYATGVDYPG